MRRLRSYRQLLAVTAAALGLSAIQASAQAPFSPRTNDETDQRWVYRAPGAGEIPNRGSAAQVEIGAPFSPRAGDQNDLRWLYRAPGSGVADRAASPGASVGASTPRHEDETDLRWMDEHKPPFKR